MKKLIVILGLLLASPSFAADNSVIVTPGVGVTMRSKDIGAGVQSMFHILGDVAGSAIYGTAGAANANILSVQGIASMTPLLATVTGTVAATQSGTWNITNISGTVSLPTGAATAANQAIVTTWAGGTLGAMANYGTSPGAVLAPGVNAFVTNTLAGITPGDAIATSTYPTGSPTLGATLLWNGTTYDRWKSAGATGIAGVRPTDGTRNAIIDPCEANLQTYAPISITTATTTRIVAPSGSNKTYICHLFLTSAAADNVGIVEGTGGTCGTGTAGVIGGTTAANGPNFAANGGVALHAGGKVAVAQTAGTNVDLCLITSAATPLAGGIKYVQAP